MRNPGKPFGLVLAVIFAAAAAASAPDGARKRPSKEPPPKEKKAGEEGAKEPAAKVPEVTAVLKDGTTITGTLAAKAISLSAPAGEVSVPVGEIFRIRAGRAADPDLARKVEKWMEKLKADDFEARETAAKGLLNLGNMILPEVKKAAESAPDLDVKTKCREIAASMEKALEEEGEGEESEPAVGEEDEIVTAKARHKGALKFSEIEIAMSAGKRAVKRADLVAVAFSPDPAAGDPAVIAGNEKSVLKIFHDLMTACEQWKAESGGGTSYPENFQALRDGKPPFVDAELGKGRKAGYRFDLKTRWTELEGVRMHTYAVTAVPIRKGLTGKRSFLLAEGGMVHYSEEGLPTTDSPEAEEQPGGF